MGRPVSVDRLTGSGLWLGGVAAVDGAKQSFMGEAEGPPAPPWGAKDPTEAGAAWEGDLCAWGRKSRGLGTSWVDGR